MSYPSIAPPRERDLVLMEVFQSLDLGQETILSLNRCRVSLEAIFLSDLATADGRYLEDAVFNPGGSGRSSSYRFPREVPTRDDWDRWFNFWHSFTSTGNKLNVPLGNWINPTHRIWKWYYREETDDLFRIEGLTVYHYRLTSGFRVTRSSRYYSVSHEEHLQPETAVGLPISVIGHRIGSRNYCQAQRLPRRRTHTAVTIVLR